MKLKVGNKFIHYCDFCKSNKVESQLEETRNLRYSVDHNKYGQEVICTKCIDILRRL